MASKFIVAALLVMAITAQAQASCFSPPPHVPCYYRGSGSSGSSQISLTAPSAPSVSFSQGPSLSLPSATVSFAGSAAQSYPAPQSIPCPKAPAPQVHNHHDVAIPLALPCAIPLGQYCSCQKYSIKPTIVPCH